MISIKTLDELWRSVTPSSGNTVGRRADPSHPLDFFITYDEENNLQLMLLSASSVLLPNSSQEIAVRQNRRSDGQYAICFSLRDNGLREMYVALCWDLMNCTEQTQNTQSGIKSAVQRFRMWQRLFSERRDNSLSDEEIRGLIGELSVLKDICAPHYGISTATGAWVGSLYADRDFEFGDCWYEAKATSLSKDTVTISSFDQLDAAIPGILAVCRLEKTSAETERSISLRYLAEQIELELADDDEKSTLFKNRLLLGGYREDDEGIDNSYLLHSIELYCVDESFPKIIRSNLPTAIQNGKYSIELAGIQDWRI